jgi:hypothetical protein
MPTPAHPQPGLPPIGQLNARKPTCKCPRPTPGPCCIKPTIQVNIDLIVDSNGIPVTTNGLVDNPTHLFQPLCSPKTNQKMPPPPPHDDQGSLYLIPSTVVPEKGDPSASNGRFIRQQTIDVLIQAKDSPRPSPPEDGANIFSKLIFHWIGGVLRVSEPFRGFMSTSRLPLFPPYLHHYSYPPSIYCQLGVHTRTILTHSPPPPRRTATNGHSTPTTSPTSTPPAARTMAYPTPSRRGCTATAHAATSSRSGGRSTQPSSASSGSAARAGAWPTCCS